MPRDLALKARLERAGLNVIEVAGWQERGDETYYPLGHVNHHTASRWPSPLVAPSLGVVINGRDDLPGPLAQTFGDRTPTLDVYLVAAGRANHAGRGGWQGLSGNSSVSGHEEEHSGTAAEPLHPTRLDRMVRVAAAQAYGRFEADYVCQHHEWAPDRKIDFLRSHVNPTNFRALVAQRLWLMHNPPAPAPVPPVQESSEMFTYEYTKDGKGPFIVLVEGGSQTLITGQALAAQVRNGPQFHLNLGDNSADEVARFFQRYGSAT